jgi:MinD-like ATPase involved in chromosome partitioning or flagellar assembly/tetratricopeptide (TPR) repeat protein
MTFDAERGHLITFYSYKGGTGRSMALANVSVVLSQREGNRVLMIDFDLEAPGLHRFFPEALESSGAGGTLELMMRLDDVTKASAPYADHTREERLRSVIGQARLEDFIRRTRHDRLDLIVAGNFDRHYGTHVNTFEWERFYLRVPELMALLAEELGRTYTHVLIDSRTGLNDVSGLCTAILPEKLVVVFTPNEQNLIGSVDMIRQSVSHRGRSDDLRPLLVYPLPSRIENAEPSERDRWRLGDPELEGYQQRFEQCLTTAYQLSSCDLTAYFDDVQLQHVPFYSYGEKIAVELERSRDVVSLSSAYERFVEWLERALPPWAVTGSETLANYAAAVREREGSIELPGTFSKVPVEQIFVPPRLIFPGGNVLFDVHIFDKHPHLLIRGEVGSGKSTLVRWLANTFAQIEAEGSDAGIPKLLPIVLQERDFAEDTVRRPLFTILMNAVTRLAGDDAIDRTSLRAVVQTRLQRGEILLLIDDVDLQRRTVLASRLKELFDEHPLCRVLVTTRNRGAVKALPLEQTSLAVFSKAQQQEFLRRWRLCSSTRPVDAEDLHDVAAVVREPQTPLFQTPLMLAVAAAQYERMGGVQLVDICRAYVDTVAGQSARPAKDVVPSVVAVVLQEIAAIAVKTSVEWISGAAVDSLSAKLSVRKTAIEAALLTTGIMISRVQKKKGKDEEEWAFVDATLRDYLAASMFVDDHDDASDLPAPLTKWLAKSGVLKHARLFRFIISLLDSEHRDRALLAILGKSHSRNNPERTMLAGALLAHADDVIPYVAERIMVAVRSILSDTQSKGKYDAIVNALRKSRWGLLIDSPVPLWDEYEPEPEIALAAQNPSYERGLQLVEKGRLDEALKMYDKILAGTSALAECVFAWIGRGQVRALSDTEGALEDFHAASETADTIELMYAGAAARYLKARYLGEIGRIGEAVLELVRLADRYEETTDPDVVETVVAALYQAAVFETRRGDLPSALEFTYRVTHRFRRDPSTSVATLVCESLLLQSALLVQREPAEAIEPLQEISRLYARRRDLADGVARAELQHAKLLAPNDRETAVALLRALLERARKNKDAVQAQTVTSASQLLNELEPQAGGTNP